VKDMDNKLSKIDAKLNEMNIQHSFIDLRKEEDHNKKLKTLILRKANGEFISVVIPLEKKLDIKKLEKRLNTHLTMATSDEVLGLTGVEPGAVCPFDLPSEVKLIIIDNSRFSAKLVSVGSGDVSYSLVVEPKALLKIRGAKLSQLPLL
jgi:prolyl-tRNA editing enzyme YbaK/EbsC (Cys-tRNA(Pro) deacylase)